MNVLILGSGGREHAMSWKIAQSSILDNLFIAPGNAGTSQVGENVQLDIMDFESIKKFCLDNDIRLVVVGPEDPLVAGIRDFFVKDKELKDVCLIGPSKEASKLEGSKLYAKEFMKKYNIPTAKYGSFTKTTITKANAFLKTMKPPYVIKCDGLAAGKGVLILNDIKEAKAELKDILINKKFKEAGKKVVIEQFMKGVEVSMFVVTDGVSFKILPDAKDYKRIGEGDTGLNTGGMGAVSPVSFVNAEFMEKVKNQIIIPTVKGLKEEKLDYKGFLFFGLMKVGSDPYVIEYNVRMGDPETEVVMPRIKSDLLHILDGVATDTLSECDIEIDERASTTVMMVSGGYPESYKKGHEISGIDEVKDGVVFHAGTKNQKGKIITNGGRVLAITSLERSVELALKKSYENTAKVNFKDSYYRTDIGADLIEKKEKSKK